MRLISALLVVLFATAFAAKQLPYDISDGPEMWASEDQMPPMPMDQDPMMARAMPPRFRQEPAPEPVADADAEAAPVDEEGEQPVDFVHGITAELREDPNVGPMHVARVEPMPKGDPLPVPPPPPLLPPEDTGNELPPTGLPEDEEDKKLSRAMDAVKEDLTAKVHEIQEQDKWAKEVDDVVAVYTLKVTGVKTNIERLRNEVRSLLQKKRQLQNLKIQKRLKMKLDEANQDLGALSSALENVKVKEADFSKSKDTLSSTIRDLTNQLATLQGVPPPAEVPPPVPPSEIAVVSAQSPVEAVAK